MKQVAVIGGGLMGAGIAQTFAAAGLRVRVFEPDPATGQALFSRIRDGLGQVGDDPAAADLVSLSPTLADAVADAEFVTEAAPERIDLKRKIFAELIEAAPPAAILASNTSVIPIGAISQDMPTADRIVGTHWWNPAILIPLVEVIQSEWTSDTTITTTMALMERIGKKPAHIRKDIAGFVGNRLQHALWREAIAMVADGVCDAKTIDDCVKHSFGLRLAVLGPLENADLIGLDLTRDIHRTIMPELNRDDHPNPLLDRLIDEGKLGFKTDEGLQTWSDDDKANTRARLVDHLLQARRKVT